MRNLSPRVLEEFYYFIYLDDRLSGVTDRDGKQSEDRVELGEVVFGVGLLAAVTCRDFLPAIFAGIEGLLIFGKPGLSLTPFLLLPNLYLLLHLSDILTHPVLLHSQDQLFPLLFISFLLSQLLSCHCIIAFLLLSLFGQLLFLEFCLLQQ